MRKTCFQFLLFSFIYLFSLPALQAQEYFHSSQFDNFEGAWAMGDIADSLSHRIISRYYKIKGVSIVEYYKTTGEFIGVIADFSIVDIREIPYVKRRPQLCRLLEKYPPSIAKRLYDEIQRRKKVELVRKKNKPSSA